MDNVIRRLEESDFFTAPASTKCPLLCLIQTADSIACHPRKRQLVKKSERENNPTMPKHQNEIIIDLHLEALPPNGSNLSVHEKHEYQLWYFRQRMQEQIRYRGRRIIVIHGKGQGILKRDIRRILSRDYAGKVEYHDADFSRYEDGATLVIVK